MIGLKSWIRADKLTHLSWTSRKLLIHPLLNYLKARCMVMVLVERLEWIDSFPCFRQQRIVVL